MFSFNSAAARRTGVASTAALAAALLAAGPAAADPEFGGQVGVASEYIGKGIGKSDGQIAWSGQFDAVQGDFHAGVFGSTADLSQGSDAEIITTVGWAPEALGFEFDFAVLNRDLPGTAAGIDGNYWEYQADVSRAVGPVSGRFRVNYTPDGFAGTKEAWWVEAQGAWKIASKTKASASVATRRAHGGADYTAWNVGAKQKLTDAVSLDLRWYDTDGHDLGDAYEGRLVGALTYAF